MCQLEDFILAKGDILVVCTKQLASPHWLVGSVDMWDATPSSGDHRRRTGRFCFARFQGVDCFQGGGSKNPRTGGRGAETDVLTRTSIPMARTSEIERAHETSEKNIQSRFRNDSKNSQTIPNLKHLKMAGVENWGRL